MSSTTLPRAFLHDPTFTIEGMPEGEWRWTLPWALEVDDDGHGWLNPGFPAEPNGPEGTMCLRIKREGNSYVVGLSRVGRSDTSNDGRWHRSSVRSLGRLVPVSRFEE